MRCRLNHIQILTGRAVTGRNAPPARYAIESDSEDEVDPEDTDRAAGHVAASTSTRTRGKDDVELKRISDASIKADDLIVAVDRAGQIWAEGFQEEQQQDITSSASLREDAEVLVASRKVHLVLLSSIVIRESRSDEDDAVCRLPFILLLLRRSQA